MEPAQQCAFFVSFSLGENRAFRLAATWRQGTTCHLCAYRYCACKLWSVVPYDNPAKALSREDAPARWAALDSAFLCQVTTVTPSQTRIARPITNQPRAACCPVSIWGDNPPKLLKSKAPNPTTLATRSTEKQKQCKLYCAKSGKNN